MKKISSIPPSLSKISNLKRLKPLIGIYFLCFHGQVLYVGQSTNIPLRVDGHEIEGYDRIFFVETSKKKLCRTEHFYISVLQPRHNKSGKRSGNLIFSEKEVAEIMNISVDAARKLSSPSSFGPSIFDVNVLREFLLNDREMSVRVAA